MMTLKQAIDYLSKYDGKPVRIMEVCGSHTAAIAKSGLRELLSPKISLIGGPGCPVCVTPSQYIDNLIMLSTKKQMVVTTFGDLIRVPGSVHSLNYAKSLGADIRMVYSPMDTLNMAENEKDKTFVFAAVGFETTAPIYTLFIEEAKRRKINNALLLTSIKVMPPVMEWLMDNDSGIDGFIAPGHVCAVTGSDYFIPLVKKYKEPMVVAGFKDEELVMAVYGLVRMIENNCNELKNFYTSVVTNEGNQKAKHKLYKYFETCDATWRGMGVIKASGLKLRKEYMMFDAGSNQLLKDTKLNNKCLCGQILMGKAVPSACPLFAKECTPDNPQGACMVSLEGGCHNYYINGTRKGS